MFLCTKPGLMHRQKLIQYDTTIASITVGFDLAVSHSWKILLPMWYREDYDPAHFSVMEISFRYEQF